MAGSTLSLDSLSSPSPSPSPPPEPKQPAEPTSAGLDSDSELSELTEEEQEADKRDNAPRKGARNGAARRGRRPSRRGGRRKTSSLVPAPMWGWAETRSSSNVVEEEEEEEMAGPPRAMEEEEDEEGGDDEDEEEGPHAKRVDAAMEEEDDPPAADEDEDESASGDDAPTYRPRRSTRKPSPLATVNGRAKVDEAGGVDVEDDVDDASNSDALLVPADDPESEDDNVNETETDNDEGDDDKEAPLAADADDRATATATPMEMDVDMDITAPPIQDIAPLAAAAAASSIMAGSGVIEPLSPSSSQRSTPASSRTASPAPGSDVEDVADPNAAEEKDDDDTVPVIDTADVDATEQDGADDQDQDADDADLDDTNPDDDADNEVESDLQPAHRAEALDVLATIELKFALLRERVYVEKMEGLSWEEALVNDGTHPELLHLQRELSTRRDKRVELATRKRELEEANVNKRRRTDDDATWSWWKVARDDLQTEMIAETNRKRRRMERERRAGDRHPPVRSLPSANQEFPPAQPLRKVIKSIPFSNMRNKPAKKQRQPRLVYPELTTLSEYDIAYDLDCILQSQRERSRMNMPMGGYDMAHPHRVNNSVGYPSGPHMNGVGPGGYIAVSHSHPLGYDVYNDGGPRPYPSSANVDHRISNPPLFQQQVPPPQHHHHHPQPPTQPIMPHPHSHAPFAGPPGSRSVHMQQPQHPPPPPSVHNSHGHHVHGPPHNAPPFGNLDQDVPMHMSHHPPQPHGHGPSYFPPRRSVSPAPMAPSSKIGAGINGSSSWMGSGMGMERVYTGSGPGAGIGKGGEWGRERDRDGRLGPEDDERERIARERDKREREREREHRDREWEREHRERERDEIERQREMHHMHQQHQQMPPQHRHQQQHVHLHPGPPGPQASHHHVSSQHHHHRAHHHHVLHHHHQPSAAPPSGHSSSSLPPQGLRSPRSIQRERGEREREYESRPHVGHNQHPTEVINLTSSKPNVAQYHDQHPDFRDGRSKHGRTPSSSGPGSSMMDDRDRPLAMPFALPPSHGNHVPPTGPSSVNGRMSPRSSWKSSEDSGFRGPPPHSSTSAPPPPPGSYHGPSHESGAPHTRSPTQSNRYPNNGGSLGRGPPPPGPSSQQPSRQNSLGLHSPPRPTLPRPPVPPAPSSPPPSISAPAPYSNSNANSNRSPSRFAAPRSPPINLKLRPPSPLSNKMPASYAVLSGPGRTSTPTLETKNGNGAGLGYSVSRPPDAMTPYQGVGRGFMGPNGMNDRDRERERDRDKERERERPPPHFGPPPPPPAPSKMSVPQMVDGH
ncbi:hypothetical protein H0H87_000650 [Tephrocybe sp. NHM501043]|nr:hypothetical protein H0H87_000650 [Tephrocybe sp. NHM501043]